MACLLFAGVGLQAGGVDDPVGGDWHNEEKTTKHHTYFAVYFSLCIVISKNRRIPYVLPIILSLYSGENVMLVIRLQILNYSSFPVHIFPVLFLL